MLIAITASVVAISRMMNGRLPAIDLIDAHSFERSSVENSARSRRPVYANIAPPATTIAQIAPVTLKSVPRANRYVAANGNSAPLISPTVPSSMRKVESLVRSS